MSGICGVVWKDGVDPGTSHRRAAETLAAMVAVLPGENAGEVEQAVADGAGVSVCRRFASQQLHQTPVSLVVCDASLVNAAELAQEIGAHAGRNTAALIAALYERFGPDFVTRLQGAFSILIWDRREHKLLAAVDHFGVNRLAYYEDARVFLIATRTDALTRTGEFEIEVNPRAVANVLNFSVNPGPDMAVSKVRRIAPGTLLVCSRTGTRQEKYWDIQYGVGQDSNEERLSREMEAVVEASVARHCKDASFEQLGAFLSGGTDSSTIVGMMARAGKGRPKAFSIGFEEESFNELEYAGIAAQKFQAEHYTRLVGAGACFDVLPRIVRAFDEPFGNSSAIATYFCARLAAENGMQTLLGGDGGDELFGGNAWYASDRIFGAYQQLPRFLRKGLIEPALAVIPFENGLTGRARRYIRRSNLPVLERVMSFHFLCAHPPAEVFDPGFLEQLGGYSVLDIPWMRFRQAPARDSLDRLLYVDLKTIIAESDLPKVTCVCEAAGIQARFPFLSKQVAEFSGRIPANLKVKGMQKRYLFKRAFRDFLPREILQKKKHGFGIPVSDWLKSDQRMREFSRDILLSSRALGRGYFRKGFVESLMARHEADHTSYYGDVLWNVFALELWHRQFVDQPARVPVS
jgi:asparagine synthase (glutamine-hydrolysing)